MERKVQEIEKLSRDFQECQKLFTALGHETRQYLLCVLLGCDCGGSRVIELAKKTHLSRPAISHHMQILKDAKIVKARKEGTCIYYYLDPNKHEIEKMIQLFSTIKKLTENAPDRSKRDE